MYLKIINKKRHKQNLLQIYLFQKYKVIFKTKLVIFLGLIKRNKTMFEFQKSKCLHILSIQESLIAVNLHLKKRNLSIALKE